jgi:hypothetical protein
VDHVWELHTITDEKHWHVVTDHVKVALTCVELDGKPTRVTQSLWGTALMDLCTGSKYREHWPQLIMQLVGFSTEVCWNELWTCRVDVNYPAPPLTPSLLLAGRCVHAG